MTEVMDAVKQRVERFAEEGVFGEGKLLQVTNVGDDKKGAQYSSQVCFLSVDLESEVERVHRLSVLVKTQVVDSTRDLLCTDEQFAIEVVAYDKILPALGAEDVGIAPKMFYGLATSGRDPPQDIVILEDLTPQRFKVADDIFLDYSHVSLTLKKLGEFHGLSYKMKQSSLNNFRLLLDLIPPKRHFDGRELIEGSLLRGFKPIFETHSPNAIAEKAYSKLSSLSPDELWRTLETPTEPFGVVVHGDFNRNNILYKYDCETLVDIKVFDWATISYSDPAVDISFFMYMNISPELRAEHWDDFLKIYWEGVTSVEANPGFSFKEFLDNFAKRAVYGYFPCSFFLPMMLFPDEAAIEPVELLTMTPEEKRDWGLNSAGDKGTDVVSGIVRHLLDKGYLDDLEVL